MACDQLHPHRLPSIRHITGQVFAVASPRLCGHLLQMFTIVQKGNKERMSSASSFSPQRSELFQIMLNHFAQSHQRTYKTHLGWRYLEQRSKRNDDNKALINPSSDFNKKQVALASSWPPLHGSWPLQNGHPCRWSVVHQSTDLP